MKDPVRHCQLYKDHTCAHVDGFLCNPETCEESIKYAESLEELKKHDWEAAVKKMNKPL